MDGEKVYGFGPREGDRPIRFGSDGSVTNVGRCGGSNGPEDSISSSTSSSTTIGGGEDFFDLEIVPGFGISVISMISSSSTSSTVYGPLLAPLSLG